MVVLLMTLDMYNIRCLLEAVDLDQLELTIFLFRSCIQCCSIRPRFCLIRRVLFQAKM